MSPRVLRPEGKSRFVIFCDHASRDIPHELDNLGLPAPELARHIAWDIGAAGIAEALANILDATAVLSPVSRLVIDCNRHLTASDLIPEQSHGTVIPSNQNLSAVARSLRIERWFKPYHAAIESILIDRELRGLASIAISEHKARASANFRRETKAFENGIQLSNFNYLLTLDGVIASRGGIPLVEGGKLIGAIGCSGGTSSQDEVACKAGAATIK